MLNMTPQDHEEDLLERATRLMREAPALGELPVEPLLQGIAASRNAATRQPHWIISRIRAMKTTSKIAASILIALSLAGMGWVLLHATPALAFASVVQQLHDAQTITGDLSMQQEGATMKWKLLYWAPGHVRMELGNGMTEIVDAQTGRIVLLNDTDKSATVLKIHKDTKAQSAAASVDWIEKLRNISHNAGRPQGETEIDGVRARQFNVQEEGHPLTIFADAKTGAPLRIETTATMGDQTVAMALDHIVLGEPLEASLFSTEIPAGYTQQQTSLNAAHIGEADLVSFLTDYVDHNGVFAPSLRDFRKNTGIGAGMLAKGAKGPSPEFMKAVNQATRAILFVNQLPASADWHYAGTGVKKGDAGKAIFWYHAKDSNSFRVIYADLHVADVPSSEAPQDAGAEKQSSK
jgi:outer membrane lipoprotein-sorting protein